MGSAHLFLGRPDLAVALHREALDLAEDLGLDEARAEFLNHLGRALTATGDIDGARQSYEQALEVTRNLSNPYEEAHALRGLALTALDAQTARDRARAAHEIFAALGVPEGAETPSVGGATPAHRAGRGSPARLVASGDTEQPTTADHSWPAADDRMGSNRA
jgi:tetratricopeptide (TPR) repeat protein